MAARKVISVFGSSSPAPADPEYVLAYELGAALARAGYTVCNGGYGGIMEASARGAREAGGQTIGVVAAAFGDRQPNSWIESVVTTDSLVERLLKLVALGDAYVILKGGTGTLLEFAAVWEFVNKRMMQEKPIIVVGGFWNGLVKTLKEELAQEGAAGGTGHVIVVDSPGACVRVLNERLGRKGSGS